MLTDFAVWEAEVKLSVMAARLLFQGLSAEREAQVWPNAEFNPKLPLRDEGRYGVLWDAE